MTKLYQHIVKLIQTNGSLSVAEFMQLALTHPEEGYYTQRPPFGKDGDFITAPDISQMFGEILGVWCAYMWQQIGRPSPCTLAELGPGRGTLMRDMLRATAHIPGFHDAISVHLVEISPRLRDIQQEALKDITIPVEWHDDISTLPKQPLLFAANEFFDALPIYQHGLTEQGWKERRITCDDKDTLHFVWSSAHAPQDNIPDLPLDSIVETCSAAITIATALATHIKEYQGAGIIVDYGYTTPNYESTLQAVKNHAYHDIFNDIGQADITALVDFSALSRAITPITRCYPTVTQGEFLTAMGIHQRAHMLSQQATDAQKKDIASGLRRLTHTDAMGDLFKVLTLDSIQETN